MQKKLVEEIEYVHVTLGPDSENKTLMFIREIEAGFKSEREAMKICAR